MVRRRGRKDGGELASQTAEPTVIAIFFHTQTFWSCSMDQLCTAYLQLIYPHSTTFSLPFSLPDTTHVINFPRKSATILPTWAA